MSTIPLTKSKHLLPFVALLREAGEPVDRLLARARLLSDCVDDPESLIPSDAAFHFRQLASRTAGLPNIALDATKDLEIADLGEFGRTLLQAPTLAKLLSEFCRLAATQTTMAIFELRPLDGGDVSFCHHFEYRSEYEIWHNDLYILQWTIKLVRSIASHWSPRHLWVSSSWKAERQAAVAMFGISEASYDQHCTGFTVPAKMLAMPVPDRPVVDLDGSANGENGLAEAPQSSYAGALRQLLRSYASDRWLGIEQAGEVVGLSVRTIQRRLSDEDTTYSEVLESTRSILAGELLETSDKSLAEIASHLGYTNQGNFSRAFRRWSGVTPNMFRQQRRIQKAL